MQYREHIKEGLRNLYFSRLRSILALLGVLVGTASVVAMVLGGELATNEALKQFKSLGTDLLSLSVITATDEKNSMGKPTNLTLEQALSLADVHSQIKKVAPYTQLFQTISYQGQVINGALLGVTDSFADIVHIQLKSGRFVSLLDQYQFYCVIGKEIYNQLKKITQQEPLGQQLQVGPHLFVIIGIAESWPENNFVYANIDKSVLIPLLASTLISRYAAINNIIFRLAPDANISAIENALTLEVNNLVSGKQVSYRSAREIIAKMRKQSDILTIFLGLIGGISLLVGGIGVMNIMLVSVVERKREIGIRLAVGAKRSDIAWLFLMEAIVLSLVGGIFGVLIGIFIAYVIANISGWEFNLYLLPPLVGFSVSVTVGIFFGFYPAYQASKLDPIEALRSE